MPNLHLARFAATAVFSVASANALAAALPVRVLDAAGKPVPDAVVSLEAEAGQALPRAIKPGEISQKGLKFIPLVSVIQAGSKVSFPNNDKVRHHIYSFSAPHKFDQKLYSGTTAEPQVFEKPGTVVLGCNIHDKMVAYVRIVDTPYFGKTDAEGNAVLDAPAGKYVLKAWHPYIAGGQALEQAQRVGDGAAATASFRMTLKPPASDVDSQATAY